MGATWASTRPNNPYQAIKMEHYYSGIFHPRHGTRQTPSTTAFVPLSQLQQAQGYGSYGSPGGSLALSSPALSSRASTPGIDRFNTHPSPQRQRSGAGADAERTPHHYQHPRQEYWPLNRGNMAPPTAPGLSDYSRKVRDHQQKHTRTGQACDRCKVRKIKCDTKESGCGNCVSASVPCTVTDRALGQSRRRDYIPNLEAENELMLTRIRDMERLLKSTGVDVRPFVPPKERPSGLRHPPAPGLPIDDTGDVVQDANGEQWKRDGSLWVKSTYSIFPVLETRPTEGYLGVLADDAPLSSIKGTKLSILGTTIDVTSFDAPDLDEPPAGASTGAPLYNKSLAAFHRSTLGTNPKLTDQDAPLPSREVAFRYTEWYFQAVHPFVPILHRPSYDELLTRIYDENDFTPTTCELVIVHMVLATLYFQDSVRNSQKTEHDSRDLNDLSDKHYHWCLGRFFEIASENSIISAQALAMVAVHTRSFAKPGCSSVVANYALSRAIELGLHRALKLPAGTTNIENEVRKRIWWTTLALAVILNGRRGRPMPITPQEFDVELPLAVPDEYLTDQPVVVDDSASSQCTFLVGLAGFKLMPLFMEMYSNLYSVRRNPKLYKDVIRSLEHGMHELRQWLPEKLNINKCQTQDRFWALYTEAMILEFHLCLRHPSVSMTQDPNFLAENARVCEQTARGLLAVVLELLNLNSLDTTWYQLSVYVAAIFSIVVAHWQRRFQYTREELVALQQDIGRWMAIVYAMGSTLGSGAKLHKEIETVIKRTLGMIEQDMNESRPLMNQAGGLAELLQHQQNRPLPPLVQLPNTPSNDNFDFNSPHYQRSGNGNGNGNEYYATAMGNQANNGYGAPGTYPSQTTAGGPRSSVGPFTPADRSQYSGYGPSTPGLTSQQGADQQQPDASASALVAFASQATAQVSAAHPNGSEADQWRQQQEQLTGAASAAQAQARVPNPTNGWDQSQQPDHAAAAAHIQAQAQAPGYINNGLNGAVNSTWHGWVDAVASEQSEQFGANALLTLGIGRAANNGGQGHTAGNGEGGGPVISEDMVGTVGGSAAGTWPFMMFNGNGEVNANDPDVHGGQ